jgi:hypothetical protein
VETRELGEERLAGLGIEMERGRGFLPEGDRLDAPEAVGVPACTTWQNTFGGDRQARSD